MLDHNERLVEFCLGRERLHEFNVFPDEIVGIIAEHFLCALVEECGDPVLCRFKAFVLARTAAGDGRFCGDREGSEAAQAPPNPLLPGRKVTLGAQACTTHEPGTPHACTPVPTAPPARPLPLAHQ